MKNSDKILIGIVVGIILLLIGTFIVIRTRPSPTYQSEDQPAGLVHNYLLALQKKDFERAYQYLSPSLTNYPKSLEKFTADSIGIWELPALEQGSINFEITETKMVENQAIITVKKTTFNGNGIFDTNEYSSTFYVTLKSDQGNWKIINSGEFWIACWSNASNCPK